MKTKVESLKLSIFVLCIFQVCFTISFTLYSGSWCPYQVEKVVPCRLRNGSEPYYGPNICWRNDNGSYACTKKILYRPKYITTYKTVFETKHKCCPGLDGRQCERECFNCTSYQKLEERVGVAERRLSRLEKSLSKPSGNSGSAADRLDRFHRDFMSQNSIFSAPKEFNTDTTSLAYVTLSLRVHTLLDEFRDMRNRIRLLENELSRLNVQVDDITLSNNMAYDYGNNMPSSTTENDVTTSKDSPATGASISKTVAGPNLQHPLPSSTVPHQTSVKTEGIFRALEENLERGDIASTLNDDYGDDLYNDNSTEQYIDQLQLKRERKHEP